MSTTAFAGTDAAEDIGTGRVSLRVRLVTGAVLLVLLTVGVTGTVSWFIADQKLVQTASDRLHDAAKTFAFLYEQRIEAAHSVGQQVAEEVALAVQQHEPDTAASTEDKVPIGQKRAAITLILEPIRDLHPHYSLAVTDDLEEAEQGSIPFPKKKKVDRSKRYSVQRLPICSKCMLTLYPRKVVLYDSTVHFTFFVES